MCPAGWTQNHGNVAEIVWPLSLLITELGEEGLLKLWAFGSLHVWQNPEKSWSADTAYRVLCTPLPWPSGSSGTTGTKATHLSTQIQCYVVSQNLQEGIYRYSTASFSLILFYFSPVALIQLLVQARASFMGDKTTAWAAVACIHTRIREKKPVICSRGFCPQWQKIKFRKHLGTKIKIFNCTGKAKLGRWIFGLCFYFFLVKTAFQFQWSLESKDRGFCCACLSLHPRQPH